MLQMHLPEEASSGNAESSESDERNQSPTGHGASPVSPDVVNNP